jgi:hypothetical protein
MLGPNPEIFPPATAHLQWSSMPCSGGRSLEKENHRKLVTQLVQPDSVPVIIYNLMLYVSELISTSGSISGLCPSSGGLVVDIECAMY